jgi:hypothetical protein
MANYLCKTCREKARLRKQEKENKKVDPEKIKSVTIKIVGLSPLIVTKFVQKPMYVRNIIL